MNRHGLGFILAITLLWPVRLSIAQVSLEEGLERDLTLLLAQLQTRQDTIAVAEAAALIRIVDSACYESAVVDSATPSRFLERLDRCREKHARIWPEIERRLEYARRRCATAIYEDRPDVRWQLFLLYGPPEAEWSVRSDCVGNDQDGVCETFIYSWNNPTRDVTCQSDGDHSYPSRLISGYLLVDELNRPVYPIVQPLVFPRIDGTFDVWLSTWIRGSDFTVMSLVEGITHLSMQIQSTDRQTICTDGLSADLRMLRSVLAVTRKRERNNVVAMAYLSCEGIDPGEFTLELNVACSDVNRGRHRASLLVPSRFATLDLSDIVLLRSNVPTGRDVLPGMIRHGKVYYADPLHVYRRGDTLELYQEFLVPALDHRPSEFLVRVSAFPQTRSRGHHDKAINVSDIIDVRDTLGNPWGTTIRSSERPPSDQDLPWNAQELYREIIVPADSICILHYRLSTRSLTRDNYWLQVSITDKDQQRFFRTALTTVSVK
ncbi:MAG: hypothetical protein Kow0074_26330 [Candidatus Zixiibacteriota bacterium]